MYCPTACTLCETGYACRGGQRYICEPGTFSDGTLGEYAEYTYVFLIIHWRCMWMYGEGHQLQTTNLINTSS